MKKLIVSEMFYSIQGEGRTMGIPCIFIRLAGCNILCGGIDNVNEKGMKNGATWRCDSIEVWKKGQPKSPEEIVMELDSKFDFLQMMKSEYVHLIITGGEPLLQIEAIEEFIIYLNGMGIFPVIEIETNGTIVPSEILTDAVEYWNVSPKLSNSGVNRDSRINPKALAYFGNSDKAIFKYVIHSPSDFEEVRQFVKLTGVMKEKIWLMPAASDQIQLAKVSEEVVKICLTERMNFSSRLQIGIWNKLTGV